MQGSSYLTERNRKWQGLSHAGPRGCTAPGWENIGLQNPHFQHPMQAPTRLTMEINIKLNLKLSLREHKETSGGNPEGDAFVWDEDTDAKKQKKRSPKEHYLTLNFAAY